MKLLSSFRKFVFSKKSSKKQNESSIENESNKRNDATQKAHNLRNGINVNIIMGSVHKDI